MGYKGDSRVTIYLSQKYGKTNAKEYLAKKKDMSYNEDEVQKSQIPSG
ncbi:hypothetical protein GKE97_27055, partial [Flavonifractor plautii]|nr:hypothetical protein [Flavonifractor plautii]